VQVIMLGDGTVGKTSIAHRFTEDNFTNQYKQTIGVDFFLKRLILPGQCFALTLLIGAHWLERS
jgi:Ras-related protein Rab-28